MLYLRDPNCPFEIFQLQARGQKHGKEKEERENLVTIFNESTSELNSPAAFVTFKT